MLGILILECSRHAPLKGRPHDPPAARQPAHGGRERRGPQVDRTRGGTHGGVPVLLHRDHEELILVITCIFRNGYTRGAQIYTQICVHIYAISTVVCILDIRMYIVILMMRLTVCLEF